MVQAKPDHTRVATFHMALDAAGSVAAMVVGGWK